MSNCSVIVRDVFKSYGNKEILKNFCMTVEKGEIYGLLGASGCGKTTLLNTLVGRKKVDSGQIWVLNSKVGDKGSSVQGNKIGYMPQDVALVGEFTVRDAIFYFGRIFGMKESRIEERFSELSEFLNLPPDNRFIKNCSGGQQRRVSLAVALVHKPQLLILDEPTVGIDPLLREKIWSYLVKITNEDKISVIITTHYIEECRQANKIGLMREGRLLAEESPSTLLTQFNTDNLETVFLTLSQKQADGQLSSLNLKIGDLVHKSDSMFSISSSSQSIPDGHASTDELMKEHKSSHSVINRNRIKALLDKNCKQFYRNSLAVVFLLGMPIVQMLMVVYSLGLEMRNIGLGVVNNENMNSTCFNYSFNDTVEVENNDCHFTTLSCRFLEMLDNHPMINKIYYNTIEEANYAAHHGETYGYMFFPKNFSFSLEARLREMTHAENSTLDFGQIKVRLDMSNQHIGTTLKSKLIDLYLDFQKSVFVDCKYEAKAAEIPIQTEYIYGYKNDPFQVFVIPGVIITMMFFFGALMTSQILVLEKQEGIWDRSIVAGVTSVEMTFSHLFFQAIIAVIQTMEMIIVIYIIYEYKYIGSMWLMYLIAYFQGICGMSYGLFISSVSTNQMMSTNAVMGFYLPLIVVSGILWPVEGMPSVLQIASRLLPCTMAIEAFANVVHKGLKISDIKTIQGLSISFIWGFIFVLITLFFLKRQR
ncbi:ABC transporter G family member 23-like isoform X1 [Diabrotica virgifera virgifera]|uniref:ABC transporter G family member 20-like n=5 Tax=Diabrotica virgifera virgifera TaxID=50390 RepID=A0ABM5JPF3_DIAVI|nr:ABC transporter G family member 23-like isoform X1 [Diabrotica virgifera virgifera]